MSEGYWPESYSFILFRERAWLSQSFTPVISHGLHWIRLKIGSQGLLEGVNIAVYFADLSGAPIGNPLTTPIWAKSTEFDYATNPKEIIFRMYPTVEMVRTIPYCIVIHTKDRQRANAIASYVPAPSDYPRGHLVKSEDAGNTWDPTDLGDLIFAEWGDPPLPAIRYDPSVGHMAILSLDKEHYSTSICIRTTTSQPCHLTCWVTDIEPRALEQARTVRGLETMHFGNYSFVAARGFEQLQDGDTLYHTFRPTGLKLGTKYHYVFTGTDDWTSAYTGSPIFAQIFPGGPPWETVRRPTSPGDLCRIPYETGNPCPNHYLNVNEASYDEEATEIWSAAPHKGFIRTDLYHIDPMVGPEQPVGEVHLTVRVKYSGNRQPSAGYGFRIKTHGVIYGGTTYGDLELYYENRHWHITTNPFTGLAWTYTEINDLQIGVALRHNSSIGWSVNSYCTQVYCTIKHACCTPQECP